MEERENTAEQAVKEDCTVDKELYDRLCDENRTLAEELDRVRGEIAAREDLEKGRSRLEELVGSKTGALYERAVKKAEIEELSALSYEKRYELGYLLCLGEDAHRNRSRTGNVNPPPRFAYSAGNGQVALSAENKPTTFAAAKENAKRYLNLK